MILVELCKVFTLSLIGLTGLILLAGVIAEAMKSGLGPTQILIAVPLLLPSLLPYTVPTTTLFTTCIVYGRLSADNEILALKAAGAHIIHVVWPALVLGIGTTIITLCFFVDLIPHTGWLLRARAVGDVEELLYTVLAHDGFINNPRINWEIHVKSIEGRKLRDVIFKRRAADGRFDTVAVAKEPELRVDLAHNKILVEMRQCQVLQGENVGYDDGRIWPVEIPSDFNGNTAKVRPMDMTWTELIDYRAGAMTEVNRLRHEIDVLEAENINKTPSSQNAETVSQLMRELEYRKGTIV